LAKINPVKLKQDAEKLEKAGRADQAILLYRQIVEDNPRDWNTVKKIGDLYVRLNRHREAIGEYAKVADFYASDGFLLKAIAMWKQINKLDASSLDPYLHLAELYAKQGLMMEAKSQYQLVVDEYVKRGKTREAGDVLRKMADIDPADLKIRSRLADLYTRDGDHERAVGEHVAIAEELNKKGHLAEALQVLEKGLKVDPASLQLRQELARVHLIQKNYDRAVHYLEEAVRQAPQDPQILARLGEAYLGAKKIEEAEAISRRLLELSPDDDESRLQMGRVFLQQDKFDQAFQEFGPSIQRHVNRRETDKAAALLQQIVQRNPGHTPSLARLGEVYQEGKKEAAASSAFGQLAEAHINAGQFAEAAKVLESLVARDPQNSQHRTKLEFVKTRMAGGGRAAPAPPPPPPPAAASHSSLLDTPFLEEEFDLEEEPAPPKKAQAPPPQQPRAQAAAPQPPPSRPRPEMEPSGPLSEEDREFVEEHVAEGRVFRKYGLLDKAADQFEAVVARFPDNVEARQELRDLYKEKGQGGRAAEQCHALAEIYRLRGEEAAATAAEREARELAPAAAPRPEPPPAFAPTVHLEEEEIQLEDAGDELSLDAADEEEIPLDVEPAAIVAEEPMLTVEEEEEHSFDLDEPSTSSGGDLSGQFLDEDTAISFDSTALEEPEPSAPEPAAALEIDAPALSLEQDVSFDVEEEAEPEPPPPPPPPVAAPAPAPARKAPAPAPPPPPPVRRAPTEVERVLEEVDQYMSLGFVDDARDALRELEGRHPNDPQIADAVLRLGIDLDVPEEPAAEVDVPFEVEEERPALAFEEPELAVEPEPEPMIAAADDDEDVLAGLGVNTEDPGPDLTIDVAEERDPAAYALDADLGLSDDEPAIVAADVDEEPMFTAPEPEPIAAAPASDTSWGGGGFDLGAELGDLFGAQSAVEDEPASAQSSELGDSGLADIFKEFKKGVDKQLGNEDYDTRYNLGIAYKEMGLVDEAIAEFQLAAKDPNRLLECSSMLGICFMDKGMPKLAIKWFEKGLKTAGRREEEYQGLRYDLATAYEAAGDLDTALGIFTELYGQDANFRDVAAKLRELRGASA
jgi:tetratricopeptide (TPR) repeat protein